MAFRLQGLLLSLLYSDADNACHNSQSVFHPLIQKSSKIPDVLYHRNSSMHHPVLLTAVHISDRFPVPDAHSEHTVQSLCPCPDLHHGEVLFLQEYGR